MLLVAVRGRSVERHPGDAQKGDRSEPPRPQVYEAVRVERRDVVVSARAAGTIEPRVTVEVKSKAAGEILSLPIFPGITEDQQERVAEVLLRAI